MRTSQPTHIRCHNGCWASVLPSRCVRQSLYSHLSLLSGLPSFDSTLVLRPGAVADFVHRQLQLRSHSRASPAGVWVSDLSSSGLFDPLGWSSILRTDWLCHHPVVPVTFCGWFVEFGSGYVTQSCCPRLYNALAISLYSSP